MALRHSIAKRSPAIHLAILLAVTAVAAVSIGITEASAQQPKKKYARTYNGPPRAYNNGPNYSYMSGPRTRVYVTRRSWLDAGTEVQPGERKFTDYAFPPGYSYGRLIDRRYNNREPLSDNFDLGGYPTRFPLY